MAQRLLQQVQEKWRREGLRSGPGASRDEIEAFKRERGVQLPADFDAFLAEINGCDSEDSDHLRLWPLQEVEPLEDSDHLYVFADYLAWSHAFAIGLGSRDLGTIYVVGDEKPLRFAESFTDFLSTYVDAPDRLVSPPVLRK